MCIDNLRKLPQNVSDMLCRLSTGGGLRTRKLYTDADEIILDVTRPVILTGIKGVGSEQDLIDRSIQANLPPIPPDRRQTEAEFKKSFEKARPRIFGGLVQILSSVLGGLPSVHAWELPRMADFAKIGIAVEKDLEWPVGSFLSAYSMNHIDSISATLEETPETEAVIELAQKKGEWQGTASMLVNELRRYRIHCTTKGSNPRSAAKSLSSRLRSQVPILETMGVRIEFDLNIDGEKGVIRISQIIDAPAVEGEDSATLEQHAAQENLSVVPDSIPVTEKDSAKGFDLEALKIDTPHLSTQGSSPQVGS